MHSRRTTSSDNKPRPAVAIVGGESLLGKEVRELFDSAGLPASVSLIASESEDASIIALGRDEPIVISSLQVADLATARIAVLAGSKESSQKAFERVQAVNPTAVIIDLSGSLEDHPTAQLRAPLIEPSNYSAVGPIQVIAHPAAIAIALFLIQLRNAGAIRRSVINVFEPASERGQAGIDELQKQTVGLLSLKPLVKDVYDAQVSFNMLSQYGSDSPHSLEEIELKIDRHLATLLAGAGALSMPSLRLIQTPVFHGYSMSVWIEFENNPERNAIVEALTSPKIDLRAHDEEPPTNVGAAGQSGITIGAIAPDRNHPRAHWFWMVADNLRITAENALEVARVFLK
ncbi:MAG TPA: Asd/ArgC dimerization domain-containing protein [Bryobacteraceae bacterium]|jgi:aspartate-semialdehyde dehydrogenase|nr:Asd/ArgC dimerization domain-containing protein [Bryobacteraceae bacterium]